MWCFLDFSNSFDVFSIQVVLEEQSYSNLNCLQNFEHRNDTSICFMFPVSVSIISWEQNGRVILLCSRIITEDVRVVRQDLFQCM